MQFAVLDVSQTHVIKPTDSVCHVKTGIGETDVTNSAVRGVQHLIVVNQMDTVHHVKTGIGETDVTISAVSIFCCCLFCNILTCMDIVSLSFEK